MTGGEPVLSNPSVQTNRECKSQHLLYERLGGERGSYLGSPKIKNGEFTPNSFPYLALPGDFPRLGKVASNKPVF